MTDLTQLSRRRLLTAISSGALVSLLPGAGQAVTLVTGFRQGVAEAAARDEALSAFYRARNFEGIWTGDSDIAIARRNALLSALTEAPLHGLPESRHDPRGLIAMLQNARSPLDQGVAEVELSARFLRFARDVNTGMLTPGRVISQIKRDVPLRDRFELLTEFADAIPSAFMRDLAPTSPEYARLIRARMQMEALIAQGGWGPAVPSGRIEPGQSGDAVVALRNRLIAMAYLMPTPTRTYDAQMVAAVERVQAWHGLNVDGIAGESTIAAINVPPDERMKSVIVALERERWSNIPRGDRHIWVNLCDQSACIVDHDRETFRTRGVIGAKADYRQTPEFSDEMEYMDINPTWFVPRSIITRDYLPALQRNRNALSHLRVVDRQGRVVNRNNVDFSRYSASSFPYAMQQPPSRTNALGLVKFMFPNVHNIYLHDTPAKELFAHETRTYSYGCVRLNDPFEFAYTLLERQTPDPEGFFHERLRTGSEIRVRLEEYVPVHLDYRTAFTHVDGTIQFRRDIYDRDARIWQALAAEGVAVTTYRG
ncbi:MAG: L,D-transpeptidase family protein [Rubellimicrobium sp.]|nr:L,D-transpeptidase family protein [Rubellimicrobium sp.]